MTGAVRLEKGGSTMLVLSRKIQESVVVGGSDGSEQMLKVTVLEIASGKVRLGFEVDKTVPVHRWEVWERIRTGKQEAPSDEPRTTG
jgi:carbon storage regulator CsrA